MTRTMAVAAVLSLAVLTGCPVGPVTPPPPAQVPLEVVNQTNGTVCFLYISPCSEQTWGPDVLGQNQVLPSGGTATIAIAPGCWDFRATDCDGTELASRMGNTVTEAATWTLAGNVLPTALISVENRFPATVCYLYISPCESEVWGDDVLGQDQVLESGATASAEVPVGCFDFKADDCDGNEIGTAMRVDVSQDTQLILE